MPKKPPSLFHKYGYFWVTLGLFLFSLAGHWLFGWYAYIDEQQGQHMPVETAQYMHEMLRDTLENWQSEFLQLIWQVAGLTYLLYAGSPQSKEGQDRVEAKIDALLLKAGSDGRKTLAAIDDEYSGR